MASPSIPNQSDSVSLSKADMDELREICYALDGLLRLCKEGEDGADAVFYLLGPWSQRLFSLLERV